MIKIKKILCPVDFLPGSDHAVTYAAGLASVHKAKIYLVHAVAPMVPTPYADSISTVDITESLERAALREMTRLVAKVKARGVNAQGTVVHGQVKDVIERAISDQKPDLITMGTHNRSTLERWFMGSVTEWLIRHSPVPVLTVAPKSAKKARMTKRAA
jgi:nucleotide-binding universal stress UspA family protein